MSRTVSELSPDRDRPRLAVEYLRSKCDPRVVIDTTSGECYWREDGEKWEHPAYKCERFDLEEPWQIAQPKTAYCDDAIYTPKPKAVV